ncbi:hypothetical protein ACISOF_09205 [Campylobacter jejuni]
MYKEKNDEIDELLPGATSAGLAEAYKDEREVAQTNIKTWNIIFGVSTVSYTHIRAHETRGNLVCRLLLEKKYNLHLLQATTT